MQNLVDIKFKNSSKVYTFCYNNLILNLGDKVVVETQRGVEIGEVASQPISSNDSKTYAKVIRLATSEDLEKAEKLEGKKQKTWEITSELVKKYNLEMKLVDIQFTLDNSKVIISFVCDERVDFRELVKDLASKLKQRVELRQIGIRDQAHLIGGLGVCGRECCCKNLLNDFDKVSIKMAKLQGLSLNPTKISGVCGRLMCCLSYENNTYADAEKRMPKVNSSIKTPDGIGTVSFNNLLTEKVTVRFEKDGEVKMIEYTLDELNSFDKNKKNNGNNNERVSK